MMTVYGHTMMKSNGYMWRMKNTEKTGGFNEAKGERRYIL